MKVLRAAIVINGSTNSECGHSHLVSIGGRNQLVFHPFDLFLRLRVGLGNRQTHHDCVCPGIGRSRPAPNVRSRIEVGEERVTVDRAQWDTEHHIEQIGRKDAQL